MATPAWSSATATYIARHVMQLDAVCKVWFMSNVLIKKKLLLNNLTLHAQAIYLCSVVSMLCAVTLYCSSKPLGLLSGCTRMVFVK